MCESNTFYKTVRAIAVSNLQYYWYALVSKSGVTFKQNRKKCEKMQNVLSNV